MQYDVMLGDSSQILAADICLLLGKLLGICCTVEEIFYIYIKIYIY